MICLSKDFKDLIESEEFIEAVAVKIAANSRLQMLILESIIKNVATKEDIRELRHYIDVRIEDLDKRIDSLDKRIDSLDKRINLLQWVMVLGFSIISIFLTVITFMISTLPAR